MPQRLAKIIPKRIIANTQFGSREISKLTPSLLWMILIILGVFSFFLSGLSGIYSCLSLQYSIALGYFPTGQPLIGGFGIPTEIAKPQRIRSNASL